MSKSPFVVKEYIALPGDVTMFHAIDEATGIMCAGKQTYDAALEDANALNAAFNLGVAEGFDACVTIIEDDVIDVFERAVKAARRAAGIVNE